MKKILKIILIILSIVLIFLIASTAVHHILLKIEENKIAPNGTMVEVNGHNMHIYTEGDTNDKPTLVFLSGSSTVAPVYDFKVIYDNLSDDYQIAVIEKAGYGYSESCDIPRDVDTMVEESRKALELAGIQGKYILLPHSMSGLESLYWAQKYPDEIQGIIGLDMALPDHYMNFDYEKYEKLFDTGKVTKFLGMHRTFGFSYPLSDLEMTDDEIQQQKYLMYKNAVNEIYYIEGTYTYDNAMKIKENQLPQIKMLLMVSDGSETSEDWIEVYQKFADETGAGTVFYECGHSIHYYESQDIISNIISFIEE